MEENLDTGVTNLTHDDPADAAPQASATPHAGPAASQDPIISINFSLSALNFTLQALGDRPYGQVKGLIDSITSQAQAQLGA